MDLISVIIPYFKKKKFIEESVNSILNQSYANIEILIIYDDKDPEDLKYLNEIFTSNKKIRIIVNETNIGAGLSRNKGISMANGKYIGFLDADDYWDQEKVFKQIKFMKENNFKVSHTSYQIVDEDKNILNVRKARDFNSCKDLIKSCDIGLSTVIIEKAIIKDDIKFVDLKTKEDFVLWLKILQKNILIGSLNETLSSWRKLDNSLSSSVIQKLKDAFKVYNYYMKFNFIKSFYYMICLSINFLRK
jgi:teichuronic acid biosynthesis glycosyltransferase TuaG